MKLFDFCCPTKSKKTIDYISKWIDETDIELKQIHTDLSRLITNMNGIVAEDLAPIFDEYARNYDYSSVIPELNELSAVLETKATVPSGSVNIGDIVVFGANKSLVDSGTKLSDISGGGGTSIHSEGTGTAVNARASVFTDIDSDPGSANGGVIGLTVTDVNNQTKSCEIDVSNFDNLTKALNGDYAAANHNHNLDDINRLPGELVQSTEIVPSLLFTTEHWEIENAQEEAETKQLLIDSIENLIVRAFAKSRDIVDVRFNIGVTLDEKEYEYARDRSYSDDDQHFSSISYQKRCELHVWSVYKGSNNTYDFHLEVTGAFTNYVMYTVVHGVQAVTTNGVLSLSFSNATFEEEWSQRLIDNMPQELWLYNGGEYGISIKSKSVLTNFWCGHREDCCYPVIVCLDPNSQGQSVTKVLGRVQVKVISNLPHLHLYVGKYFIDLMGQETASDIRLDEVNKEDVTWSIEDMVNLSNLDLTLPQ